MPSKKKPSAKAPAPAKRSKKLPRDVNQLAHFLVRATTELHGEEPSEVTQSEISRVMAELGRRGGRIGGKARADNLTSDRRSEIALRAARARWDKEKKD